LIDQPWIFSKVLGHDRPYDKGQGRGRQKERKWDRVDNGRVGEGKGVVMKHHVCLTEVT